VPEPATEELRAGADCLFTMPFAVPRPSWLVVAFATAAAVLLVGLQVSTQGPGRANRLTRINGAEAVEGEVLVKYRDGSQRINQLAVEAAVDADEAQTLDRQGTRRVRSRRFRTVDLLAMLSSDPDIEFVEPNYTIRLLLRPNDSQYFSLWGLFNTGVNPIGYGGAAGWDIHAEDAWNISTGSRNNVVAILDSGVDYNHPDLAANMWSAPSAFQVTVGGVTVTCQAGTHGFNAITRTCDPMDDHYHGTHAAGTIGAVGNNGLGVTGVNWIASMMAVKILNSTGGGTVADAVAGLEFVVQAKAAFPSAANVRILNNSWGSSGPSVSLQNAITATNSADMLFVAAAGNSGSNNDLAPVYPASYGTPNVVAVAASTNWDERATFSNYGATSVDLAAPGTAILSTGPGNTYRVAQGTSMAAPHVSGAGLLALSMCMLSTQQLKYLLLQTVEPRTALAGITATGGRLSARDALDSCPYPKVVDMTMTPHVASPQALGTTVRWVARPEGGRTPYEFRWLVWDGTTWITARNWAPSSNSVYHFDEFEWIPGSPNGSYRVMAQVRSAWNTGAPDLSVSKPFVITAPVTSATLTPNLATPQGPGATVTWTASAAGGTEPYEYQFKVYDGGGWTVARSWSTSNTFSWTPSVPNPNYRVMVQVRGTWNDAPSGEFAIWKPFPISAVATSVTLTSNLTSPRLPGTTVVWSAAASGGEQPYQYQFLTWNGSAWTIARAWSTTSTFSWTPTVANANYFVAVHVRSAWNTGGDKETSTSRPFVIVPPVSSASLSPDMAAPRGLGTTVTFTASASGGQSPYQFRWGVRRGGVWTVGNWSSSNAFAWTPTLSGTDYQVRVEVRGSWNTAGAAESTASVTYPIMPVATAATVTPNLSSPRAPGTTIRWTASASGGQAPYQYRWAVWNGSTWTTVSTWSTSNWFDWTPTVANANYKVAVVVRSAWNTSGQAEFTAVQPFVVQ
jgi:hypothetical protein